MQFGLTYSKAGTLQVRRLIKSFLVSVLLAVFLWLSTLGLFVRRSVMRSLSVRTPLENLEPAIIDVRAHAVESNRSTSGVPYLYCRTQDEPDYGITIIFNAKGDLISKILLTQVVVGGTSSVLKSPIALEPYSPPLGDTMVFRKTFLSVFAGPKAQQLTLQGVVQTSNGDTLPFETSVLLPFERETMSTVGWLQLLYYGQF